MSSPFESTETVENEGTAELVLVVEPWARTYSLPPRSTYIVRAKSGVPGALEVERDQEHIVCWAWPGSTVEVWSGEQLLDSLDRPVPEVPKGMSVRSFLSRMYGHEDDERMKPIREYTEWAQHRYDPGHYLGGTLEPHLRKYALGPRARRHAGLFLAVIAAGTSLMVVAFWPAHGLFERLTSGALAMLTWVAAWKMYRSAARS
jgi:hypothetical protein